MILTPHILTGAIIGSKISSLIIVFFMSFFSHYLLDMIPHHEYDIIKIKYKKTKLNKELFFALSKIIIDFSVGLLIALWFIWNKPYFFMAIFGIFSSLLPDGLLFLYWNYPNNRLLKFFAKPHNDCHFFKNSPVWLGIGMEILLSLTAIIFLVSNLS